jgi:hypothetical protein
METKEKAQELVDRFYNLQSSIAWDTSNENKEKASIFNDELGADVELYWHELAKQSALLVVDEIVKVVGYNSEVHLWEQVKQEIINL